MAAFLERRVGFVTRWLIDCLGGSVRYQQDAHNDNRVWIREATETSPSILIEFTERALDKAPEQLLEWLEEIAEDIKDAPPIPPGKYFVSTDGVSMRGMEEIRFEEFGQEIRCYGFAGPVHAGNGQAPVANPAWRISIEGRELGPFVPWSEYDQREQVARAAVTFVVDQSVLRPPPMRWSWSVIDEQGREWVGPLTTVDVDPAVGRELVLRDQGSGLEHRLPWGADARPPTGAEIRRLASRLLWRRMSLGRGMATSRPRGLDSRLRHVGSRQVAEGPNRSAPFNGEPNGLNAPAVTTGKIRPERDISHARLITDDESD